MTSRAKTSLTQLAFLALVLTLLLPTLSVAEQGTADPEAAKVANRLMDAMGGQEAWDAVRYLRFEFFGFRLHHWDRATGHHRMEGKTRDGDEYVVVHNLNTREGHVWLNGEKLSGDDHKKWLEQAYGGWINDTYWLLMPYKLRDPGVTLTHDGTEELDGATYDKLKLTFDNVGLTPGDTYWAYVNRETGLMDRWAYSLQSHEEGKAATHWKWLDWQEYGGVKLASKRVNPENGREAELGNIAVLDHLDEAVFKAP